jgi:hypothetical protein
MSANFLCRQQGGKVSMMRLATMMVVTSIMGIWAAHNIVAMATGGGFVSMGQNEMMLIALTLGAKAAQYFGELKANGNGNGNDKSDTLPNGLPKDKP